MPGCRSVPKLEQTFTNKYSSLLSKSTKVAADILDTMDKSSSTIQQLHRLLRLLPDTQVEIRQLREELKQHTDDREFQSIADWLSPLNFRAAQLDILVQCQAGTGRWLLDSSEFLAWLDEGPSTLLCWGLRECH